MSETIAFELVTPERLALQLDAQMVVLPAAEGDLGVLPGHTPVIAALRPGVICIFSGGKPAQRLFVPGGFLEVTPERCAVLAEQAAVVSELDRAALEREVADLKSDLAEAKAEEREKLRQAVEIAEAKLTAVVAPIYG